MYGLLLVIDRSTKIFMNEGGVNYVNGSRLLKDLGGISYILLAMTATVILIVKVVTLRHKEEGT